MTLCTVDRSALIVVSLLPNAALELTLEFSFDACAMLVKSRSEPSKFFGKIMFICLNVSGSIGMGERLVSAERGKLTLFGVTGTFEYCAMPNVAPYL